MVSTSLRRRSGHLLLAVLAGTLFVGTAAAHGGSLGAGGRESIQVPTWLFLLTGGGAVGASFLLASFVTDRLFIRELHGWGRDAVVPGRRLLVALGKIAGLAGLAAVLGIGFLGPDAALANLGLLLVWVGWWAGFTMTTYLVGNTWPILDPFRTLSSALPTLDRDYPERFGAWPSVVGLLALIWLEVVSPLADDPGLLATTIVGYGVVTLAGAFVFGPDRWFTTVDPVARVFRYYGRVAPLTRDDETGTLRLRLPGSALTDARLVDGLDEVGFVVALVWVTTYDGLVATPLWADFAPAVVDLGVPPAVLYPLALVVGYLVFFGAYWLAARGARRLADSYVTPAVLARRFAPPLLAIAAGYHLAHYLEYFLSLFPAALAVAPTPLAGPAAGEVPIAVIPGWFGALNLTFVLLGHLLAIWVAHAAAFDRFPGRLQAIRSQYTFTLVMVCYTMVSLWIVSQPSVTPPFL
ncbi:hypothetical protein BV210_14350 [Halorientalis sp. IM1011]|uniref:hypothetical protein n=1 Tax=Halorientalis sp. IM1011 TaxID=1932360 RepID=UPI00097CCFEC|nr:hypothetical protein [Halorientalis sp. IM1011]AQL43812.1 hypothetical protein BV210_14350 [Halorientalis sp. IM1011]